jgi:UDP-glucose 4-epimerase
MKILVTGGAGFIGSHLVDSFVEDSHDVVVLDDLSTGHQDNVHPKASLILGDIADENTVRQAMHGVEVWCSTRPPTARCCARCSAP